MIATPNNLGLGIYTPAEAAFYARVSTRMMTRWVFGNSDGKSVIDRQIEQSEEKIVTFLDFVQTLAVRAVRQRHKIPLQRIREAVSEASKIYGVQYPLARDHCIYLFGDQQGTGHGQILICLSDEEDEANERYVQLTGKQKGSVMLKPIVEMFLADLKFDYTTKLASQYRPMSDNGISVLLDPHRRFGEPVIEPSGYTVETLWHATTSEGGIEDAAEAYGVQVSEVEMANKYYDVLLSQTGA